MCNNVSYALDNTEKWLYKWVSNKTKDSYVIFCIYMSTLHDMVEQIILVVLISHGNTSISIHIVQGQPSVWRDCGDIQARLSLVCLVVRKELANLDISFGTQYQRYSLELGCVSKNKYFIETYAVLIFRFGESRQWHRFSDTFYSNTPFNCGSYKRIKIHSIVHEWRIALHVQRMWIIYNTMYAKNVLQMRIIYCTMCVKRVLN